jgi:hypothetical protein
MLLEKFSLMNPDEVDHIEQLQQTVFRPNSYNQAKQTAQSLLAALKKSTKKLKGEEAKMYIRLSNLLKSSSVFAGFTEQEYLVDLLGKDTPSRRIAITRLMKDTNKGISDISDQLDFPFTDGTKPTEKLGKLRLVNDFGVKSEEFLLLSDTGPSALFVDEKTGKISRADDMTYKTNRSVDAITELKNVVIVWCMKYKGGTAAVGGSGQTDQGTTEGKHFSEYFEKRHQSGEDVVYNGKPVFFANLVYGGQFNDHKRIVGNEMAFKLDYDCKRSFNISLDRVKDVIEFFKGKNIKLDTALDMLYNKYAYNLEYTGNPKKTEKARLLEWTNTNSIMEIA